MAVRYAQVRSGTQVMTIMGFVSLLMVLVRPWVEGYVAYLDASTSWVTLPPGYADAAAGVIETGAILGAGGARMVWLNWVTPWIVRRLQAGPATLPPPVPVPPSSKPYARILSHEEVQS